MTTLARQAKTARQFAEELERAGCRIEWHDYFTDSTFVADHGRGKDARSVRVVFYADGSAFDHAEFGIGGRAGMGGGRLRSMTAVRRYLKLEA